jgi:integrase
LDEKSSKIIHLDDTSHGAELVSRRNPEDNYVGRLHTLAAKRTGRQAIARFRTVYGLPPSFSDWGRLDSAAAGAIRDALLSSPKRYSPKTVAVTLAALRGVMGESFDLGLITAEEYAKAMRKLKAPRGKRMLTAREIPAEELRRLRTWLEGLPGAYGAALRAIFTVLIDGGLRARELCELPVAAYTGAGLRFIRKGDKESTVPLNKRARGDVEAWLEARAEEGITTPHLFARVQRGFIIDRPLNVSAVEYLCDCAAEEAGVPRIKPHDCRRTLATALLRKGVDVFIVQDILGHASSKTTELYDMRGADDVAKARDAVEIW